MFWLGLVGFGLFLYFGCNMEIGAVIKWCSVYTIICFFVECKSMKRRRN